MPPFSLQIQFDNLISLLAEHLYADPNVFVRELIQNAHDAIVLRQMHDPNSPAPAISLHLDSKNGTFSVTDNGAGMDLDEIHSTLSTIGGSNKREWQSRLGAQQNGIEDARRLIGQFGIGLLSAFIVAERVEIETRTSKGDCHRWTCYDNGRYDVESTGTGDIGSRVTLFLKSEHLRYLSPDYTAPLVRRYADILGFPVFLNDGKAPVNAVFAPWSRSYISEADKEAALAAFWNARFPRDAALELIEINEAFSYLDPFDPPAKTGRVRGVLAVTDRRIPGVENVGGADLFVARMFVAEQSRILLPDWAVWTRGVLECGELSPNAARDNVLPSPALDAAREAVDTALVNWIRETAHNRPARFKELMHWHSYSLLSMCALEENHDFFEAIARLVPLHSDNGMLTLDEILPNAPTLSDGRRQIFWISDGNAAAQVFLLARERGWSVFQADAPFAEDFLRRCQATWPDLISLSQLDGDDYYLLQTPEESEVFEDLVLRAAPILECTVEMRRFEPVNVPALWWSETQSHGAELTYWASHPGTPEYLRGILRDVVEERRPVGVLHLNSVHPAVIELGQWAREGDPFQGLEVALKLLYLRARTLSHGAESQLTDVHECVLSNWMDNCKKLHGARSKNLNEE